MAFNKKKRVKSILKKLKKFKGKTKMNPLDKQKYLEGVAKKMEKNKTWPEREFEKLLEELEVKFETQRIVGEKIFDYYIPSKNLLVEVDGDYYHGNPETNDKLSNMQRRNQKNDQFKDILASGKGYSLERVWESDLKKNYNIVKKHFIEILKS